MKDELADGSQPSSPVYKPISGTYVGQRGTQRLELRLDLTEQQASGPYQPLDLISGDLFRNVGGEEWAYRSTFVVDTPRTQWGKDQIVISGLVTQKDQVTVEPSSDTIPSGEGLRVTIPTSSSEGQPTVATVEIVRWNRYKTTFSCQKTSDFLRTIDLEIDRVTGTELPRTFNTQSVATRPADLPALELDIARSYQRSGIDMRIISKDETFPPAEAGTDSKWDEDELHNAMQHHFSQWQDEPQWKLYLLIATHYKLYPDYLVSGIMYDSQDRDANDLCPRQGAAVFHSTMQEVWGRLPQAEFDRNYVRTCVHELGHALNLLHSFDKDRPDSASWMNYPWRYPYGYNLPSAWNGTEQFWKECRFEFDPEELYHLRHHSLTEVIPGGAAFGSQGHDVTAPLAVSPAALETAPVALYVRTRPERNVFNFAEPVSVEVKLKNQSQTPMVVPDMLNPELGLLRMFICDPKGRTRPYQPLFKLCGEARTVELPPGEKLFESVFLDYGADGFHFEEPGEYQIWGVYSAGGLRLRSNALRIRVAFPQTRDEEKIALWTFGRAQGHVLYMHGAEHLQGGTNQLREVTEQFPTTARARYINFCLGNSYAHEFKDVVSGQVRPPAPEKAVRQLVRASTLLRETQESALDNITHGRVVNLLASLYQQMNEVDKAESLLAKTARYFARLGVKQSVVDDLKRRIVALKSEKGQEQ